METYSDDGKFAKKLNEYVGHKLKYFDSLTGRDEFGVLRGTQFDLKSHSLVALFERSNFITKLIRDPKKVPLRNVLLPTVTDSRETSWSHAKMSRRNAQPISSTSSRRPQTRQTFQYSNQFYYVTDRNDFKPGGEVVWNKYSNNEQPCIGNVVVTAERDDVINHLDFQEIAIVQFEFRPISQTGSIVPGYFAYLSGYENTFVVPLKELFTLSEWVSFRETDDQDQWTEVKYGKKEKRNQKKYDEKDTFEENLYEGSQSSQSRLHGSEHQKENISHISPNSSKQPNSSKNSRGDPVFRPDSNSIPLQQYSEFIPKWDDEWQFGMNKGEFIKMYHETNGIGMGVQGNNNSCYMDSSLFALFAFNETLDNYLLKMRSDNIHSVESKVKGILRDSIIFPMRHRPYVPHEHVQLLRNILSKKVREDYLSRYMDVEEFLTDLFKLAGIPPFLNYDNDEGDYIHQITLPFTWEENQYQPYLTLQSLLENSFDTFDVKLTKRPECAFIVKLPISDGTLVACNGVIPNLTLNLSKMLTEPETTTDHNRTMTLHAVICLRRNHFVVFVRPGNCGEVSWVLMDSKPTMPEPCISLLPNADSQIIKAVRELEGGGPAPKMDYEPACEKFALFRNAYICIYV